MLSKNPVQTLSSQTRAIKFLSGTFVFLSFFALSFIPNIANPPAPGVITELRCDEGTGTTIADASGNSHPGTLTNGPTWGAGKYGQGINLDGSNDYINIADHTDYTLTPTVSYTWSAWVRNNNFNQWSTLWSQTLNTTNFFYFYAHSSSDGEAGPVTNGISVYWYSGSSKLVLHSNNNVLTAGTWSYVTVTYNAGAAQASRFTIYVNGVDVTNRTDVVSSGTIAAINPTNIRVGSNQPYGEYLNGSVDEIRYYTRLLSVAEIQSDMNIGNGPDVTAPTVNITAPAAGNVAGTINMTANAGDNIGVAGVQFLLDGANLGAEDITSPYSVSWNTTTVSNGNHTLTARARDAAGNNTTSAAVIVNVNNDVTAPTVNITAPVAGDVSGTINVTANASDNIGVAGVQFLLDGSNLGAEDVTAPYSVSWNTGTVSSGNHTLTARARDAAGNATTSAGVIVNVNNNDVTAPVVNITAPAAGNVSGTINVTANASDNIGVAGVQFLLDGNNLGTEDVAAPYTVSWNTTTAGNGSHEISARARDAAGNSTTSAVVTVNVNNDVTPPTVTVNAPASSPVSGTITVSATANDNVGIAGVQFLLDGNNLGTEDVTSPYSVSWNTTTTTNGTHNITARARDAAGNITTSIAVPFNVFNNNLVAAYGFNENTGTTANDNSGNNNNGTLTNGPTWSASGKYGAAILFDGTNDLVNVNDANSLDLSGGMTIEAWVSASNLTGYKTVICKERTTNGFTYTMAANNNTSGAANQRPNGRIRIGSSNVTVTGTSKLVLNTWTHIATTYDGTALRFYINGVQTSSTAATGNITATTNLLRIGGSLNLGTQYFAGLIDEVRIYNRALSAAEIVTDMNTPIAPDVTNPTTNITTPANGANISATINVTANASDNIAVAGVQFLLDGNNLGAEDVTAPYSVSWNTTTISDGSHTLTTRARDGAGNTATSADVVVTVDNNVPTINITSPAAGTIAGNVDVNADANDNNGVAGVQFLLNGNNLGPEDIVAPYSFSWNTNNVTDGSYTLTARVRDVAGNITTSSGVVVNVLNNPPDTEFPTINITAPAAGDVIGTVNVTADANDNVAVVGVQFLLNGANLGSEDQASPYSVSWNTLNVTNGTYTLTAKARDAAGNITTSAEVVVTVSNPPDTESPTVAIIEPGAGTISGIVNLVAGANDNIGIVGVQFILDGNDLGAEDIVFPYSFSWNTTSVGNGIHTISARARDAAGNITTSAGVDFTIDNDVQGPAVGITSPTGGTVSGTINVTADANDNVGVIGVQFLLNGSILGAEDVTAPYSVSWNTLTATNGNYNLTARARDAAGNITLSSPVVVTVNNITNLITALHFNEGTGTNATDVSGKNHNGTLTGGASWATGKYGQAVNLNGSGNYVNIADHNDYTLDPAQNYTWSAWVKNNNFNEWSTVWSQTISTSTFFYFYAHTSSDPDGGPVTNGVSVYWWINNGSAKLGVHSSNNVLTAGQWSHIAVTYNPTQPQNNRFTIYVNGVDVTVRTDVSSTGTITSINPTNIRIGANQPFGEYLNGAIDEVRFYNRLLTATEIQTDMNTAVEVDNVAPIVNLTAPANGSNVSGNVTVMANASDNIGVAGVQFILDGVNLDVEDNTAPYSITWDSELGSIGAHVLSARARDTKGNIATSTNVNVNVVPDFSFTLTTPIKNVEVTGTTDYTINVAYLNGFTSSSVALSVSGLPANTTGNYLFNPMSHQGQTQLFINTNNATSGTYLLTLTAVAEGITHTQQATLNITGAADFALTASPAIQNVTRGNNTTFTINLNETNDFINPVTLSVIGLPAGVTASFNPPSPVPATTSLLTLTTSVSAAIGTYNLTVQGISGAITRTIPVTLTITDAASAWTVITLGSTGVPNNTVRVGHLKEDGLERIYIGTIATGRMLEYAWTGSAWSGPLDVGGSPSGQEIHNCTIGPGRGDGKERMYIASYDFNIYEIWHDATGWHQLTVGNLNGNLGMHAVVGVGRNDGVTRLYAASTQQLFEFTWNGTSWDRILIGSTPGAHELALGNGRMDGLNNIYISSISSGNFEARWNGTAWTVASMGDNGDARGLELGNGRNDGVIRIYSALFDGRIREFTWSGTAWTFVNMPMAGTQNVHAYIVAGRNDGINRIYTCNANGKVFEYTWNGATWDIYNMGGGSDYMYGLHYGTGRNDGVMRFYGADRGSVNRVYEFTWTVPIIAYIREEDNGKLSLVMKR